MSRPKAGDPAPDVALGSIGPLSELRGKIVVLYFYPKDNTPGCTTEAKDFTALEPEFGRLGARIIAVSRDSQASHDKFRAKQNLTIELVSDADGAITETYGVWVEKSLYGRKYMGIERCTFLIDRDGQIAQVWEKVKVAGHAKAVLDAARSLG